MRLGIVGTGRVGASFILALQSVEEMKVVGLMASSWDTSQDMGTVYHVTPYQDGGALLRACDVTLITVPDDCIGPVCEDLATAVAAQQQKGHGVVLHCSGAMGIEPLRPLQHVGYAVGSLHPLQSFAKPDGSQLSHIYMAVAGDEAAQKAACAIARAVQSTTFTVPDAMRPAYHAAACFASNFIVTAMALGQSLMSQFTETPADAAKALWPLIAGTMHNVQEQNEFANALTGPVARGDVGTVKKHLAALPAAYTQVYCEFAMATAQVALATQRISREQYDQFHSILAIGKGDFNEQESKHTHHR